MCFQSIKMNLRLENMKLFCGDFTEYQNYIVLILFKVQLRNIIIYDNASQKTSVFMFMILSCY